MIFPLKNLPTNLDQMVKDGRIYVSGQKSGWIDQVNFFEWCKLLVKWVQDRRHNLGLAVDAPFLMFLDSHSSRESSECLQYLKDNHIIAVTYPSHCSHLLQPLDVNIFGPFKNYLKIWKTKVARMKFVWIGEESTSQLSVKRARNVLAVINALHQSMVYTNIVSAFRLSGIFPRDRNMTLSNPRICHIDEVTMKNSQRKRIPTVGGIITDTNIIQKVAEAESKDRGKSAKKKPAKKSKKPRKEKVDNIRVVQPSPPSTEFPFLSAEQFNSLRIFFSQNQQATQQGSDK